MRLTAFLQNAKKLGDVSKKYSNFPDAYVKRSMEQVYWKTPRGENILKFHKLLLQTSMVYIF